MNANESVVALKHLLSLIEEESAAQREYALAREHLKNVTDFYATKLGAFDEANKPGFIAEKLGEEPVAPHGLIKLAVPVYLSKKKKYNEAKAFYDRAYPLAEAAYREKFNDERAALAAEDKVEQAEAIEKAKAELEAGTLQVFDTETFTVDGKKLDSYMADVDTDPNYEGDHEAIVDGHFAESAEGFRSAPYFNLNIDGITLLDQKF